MAAFRLDQSLAEDSIFVVDLPLCQVRLENDFRFPWLILIPRMNELVEVTDLPVERQHQLIDESRQVSEALKAVTDCKKINVANLGNVVSQLHWHVVARFESDAAWPGPVWGSGEARPWPQGERDRLISELLNQLVN
ncbi:HIT domain-containing protein [Corallincola platygyrae]|uniref:HIT domain-containing protein n=1 Tax=Corallincola platygyrae TaxID=1193278 RepID=A0ABW4XQ00_9GAMM